MAEVDDEIKLTELKNWAKEAIDLLDEVKPYRSIFYKQKVARLKSELTHIIRERSLLQLRAKTL